MTPTLLTAEAKDALRKAVRALQARLVDDLTAAIKGEYQLDVAPAKARLSGAKRGRRERLDAWLDEQVRAAAGPGAKGHDEADRRAWFLRQAAQEAAHTLVNRLVLLRILEHHGLVAPHVVTGGLRSPAYASEFLPYAGPLAQDDARGYRYLLDAVFAELALELPGLFGNVGLTALFPVPTGTLHAVVDMINDRALDPAWGDDTTLGWVYQYWNDPWREALDAKISGGGKIEPHEIAQKTQMFTERYMVEWLLQNSLGLTWLTICEKNGWTPDARGVLADLHRRRTAFRVKREHGEVPLDALMPIAPGVEAAWKYYVPQPIPGDAVSMAPASIRDVKLLDPACGSGHFLVIAFGLLAAMYEEEARHRGEAGGPAWSPEAIAESIVGHNLHGIDIDPRAIQIAAAGLWLKARLHAPGARLARMNLVAPTFRLAGLPKDDPARVALGEEICALGVPRETTERLFESLKGVDHLGTLLRVDREIATLLDEVGKDTGPLFEHGAMRQRAFLEQRVAAFLDAHAAESDLGLRLEGEQLAAGVRFVELAKEGRYDVVVGNPPYQGLSKTAGFEYVVKNYPQGKADLYAAFLQRGLELAREGGISALLTMRGWMFLGQFTELRRHILRTFDLRNIGDFDRGAFDEVPNEVLAVAAPIIRCAAAAEVPSVAILPTPSDDKSYDRQRTNRKRAALLAQVGRYEFDPKGFAVIEGEPIVYWWTKQFLERYGKAPKLGQSSPAKAGAVSGNHVRFIRLRWELESRACEDASPSETFVISARGWVRYAKGARGMCWIDPCDEVANWRRGGLEVKTNAENLYGTYTRQIRNEDLYFRFGVAVAGIGASFTARAYRWRAVFDNMAASVFPSDASGTLCAMNTTTARYVVQSLNPGIHFEIGDVNRIPIFPVSNSAEIFTALEGAFSERESHREISMEYRQPGPSPWRAAQDWAQLAVDRPEGAPLPPYTHEFDAPDPEANISFAIGVALGRFGANGQGILDAAPETALPAGILFVGPNEAYPDSLAHRAVAPVLAAWDTFTPTTGKKLALRDWLRSDKGYFAYHKALHETRPIYFPLSSEKKSFVAWVSIHRWDNSTLPKLRVDHLDPVLRRLDAEIHDVTTARASSDKKAAIAAEKQYASAKRLRDELFDFIANVTRCAERGPPSTDPGCPAREVDATFAMDLDDGVMVNSAALWPLLAPQWSDPKKWWKQLCLAEGRKDYDWAHLAKRYFPTRVDGKCQKDPSLAVAHGCFWKYHPKKAYEWELRLQDEIRADFTIDEDGSDAARALYLGDHEAEAQIAREKERVRRERKAAKATDDEPSNEADASEEGAADG